MRSTRPLRLLAASLALVLGASACATTSTTQSPTGSGSAPATTTGGTAAPATAQGTPTPTPTTPPIEKASLGDAAWVDVLRDNKSVTLAGGTATDGEFTYQLGDVVYSDANGDREPDALAFIKRTRADGQVKTQAYIWLWDAKTQAPVQVQDPVGEWWTCGSTFTSAKPGSPSGFEIAEKQRYWYDYQKCGTEPLHKITRTIVVSQGRLTMTKPFLAYGGICYPTYSDPSVLTRSVPVRSYPDPAAPVVENQRTVYSGMPDQTPRTWPDGWAQVQWSTDAMKAANAYVGICGFIWTR